MVETSRHKADVVGMANTTSNNIPWRQVKTRRHFPEHPHAKTRAKSHVRLTDRDLGLLRFIGAHRFVLAEHVHHLVCADRSVAYRLLSRLTDAGLLRYERVFHAQPGVFMITNGGLAVIGSRLPKPRIDLRLYRHEQHVPALWLAATAGVFGAPVATLTERELRHQDLLAGSLDPVGIRLGGVDRAGRPRVHHPDVAVIHPGGEVTALELELTVKSNRRLEEIVLGYLLDPRLRLALYITDQDPVRGALLRTAVQHGAAGRLVVKRVRELSTEEILDCLNSGVAR